MIHPLVGLFGVTLPLLVSSTSAGSIGGFLGRDRHVDNTGSRAEMSAGDAKSKAGAATKLSPVWVKLTPVETEPRYARLASSLDSASHIAIGNIPGVTVLGDDDDVVALAKKSHKPVVVLSAKLQDIVTSKEGDELVFRAQAQYIIYRIPGLDIAAVVDGAANARIAAVQVKSRESRRHVEDGVAAAAIESAASRAPAALQAISKR
jgi:hypothetical protein